MKRSGARFVWSGLCVLTFAVGGPAGAQPEAVQQRVSALKASLTESQQNLRRYEWIETTVVSVKGEEKSRLQNRCYYGADGLLQKVPVAAPAPEKKKPGLRGAIAEHKKAELTGYMQEAVKLVHQYVPPDPARIQMARDAGKASLHVTEPGKRAGLELRDYLKPGDSLGADLDLQQNRLLAVTVSTFLDSPREPVVLDARIGRLDDGTSYPSDISLEAKGKNLKVTVKNSGYRRIAR